MPRQASRICCISGRWSSATTSLFPRQLPLRRTSAVSRRTRLCNCTRHFRQSSLLSIIFPCHFSQRSLLLVLCLASIFLRSSSIGQLEDKLTKLGSRQLGSSKTLQLRTGSRIVLLIDPPACLTVSIERLSCFVPPSP
ncbi:hypothetical protein LZ32DRAFT_185429 [Colletotrichum eremochloae]|nr:hypothetical protein LZ32DRAFT_185429 [Colletotrichum eremochloae]